MPDVVIASEDRLISPDENDALAPIAAAEDGALAQALQSHGLSVDRRAWRDDRGWDDCRCVIIRTVWDYIDHIDAFRTWLGGFGASTRLFNDAALVNWNLDKRYLLDLADDGLPVVPSAIVSLNSPAELAAAMDDQDWPDVVIKPLVSASGINTLRISRLAIADQAEAARILLQGQAVLMQPFQQAIVDSGEVSIVVIDGEVSHAVRKQPARGEFRVQPELGGRMSTHEPSVDEIELARRCVRRCSSPPLFARVDIVSDNDGELALMELELIEPELFLSRHPSAADRLARAVARHLSLSPSP